MERETSSSVIEKKERAVPSTSGFGQRSFCDLHAGEMDELAVPASGA